MSGIKTKARILLSNTFDKSFSDISTTLINSCSIISFDIFDTLIIRPEVNEPSDVFDLVHPDDPSFKEKRLEAARISRLEAESKGLEERKLCEIYKHLPGYDENDEINAELKVCKANKPALTFFNKVKESGKRIIIISDMYLDSSTIEEILQNCGYDLTDVPIYVSSEYGKTKRSGNLFRTVLEHEEVEAGKVLHIGDNLISDYLMPKKCGMKSFLYRRV